ncbi:MAG: Queuine tRNA-ribosyltransferase [Candidatus Falkowbacteria bacterium GW2011_GWC2_38_22]|uniref:Queuine tRNA-ribosyltransferase n=1 Tax=Candidatus Falkowbacteria bacterium GW2011_GWE1_38_31 TaxID=1618638 RepID=A0A0G0MXY0_9BACT|nr:MAG: Queuine tRNA-ribosyltransferase [Candidatus Falkowbacteria bacterium GW2011_GWF2_38_1205]KKQ60818.1 MAG: Queuine tRNA-ribosyltransferase [Candidatus Falkowbacteria bacterium GW2011_GWC2_38_22]KKQ62985.1 MAG: Queuine tRNA-ribosyltransferase [Candidatus Falkowbacteria bacterium GW2011_GWF1_38_22]KKQ64997.1 MAG: Queuine tRNA-ribosyltransferase [Candidatus Falkowbacteria bacterium GW2011_GWE2_38_254]KKQ69761.1 MAG: Queuine tRNA-ribosyltransferase [Candidatus Falkowbacteria bacterium GW2011_
MEFVINKKSKDSKLRIGTLRLKNGTIKTPFFMPDATRAVVKNIGIVDINNLKMPAMVVNTYHLYLQPGMDLIKKAGGVNKFMNFDRPLLSDSGGFQVFSLIHRNKQMGKITDEHVEFKSPIDGSKHILTPEKSIQIQFDLGVDMMVCLDDCPPNDFSRPDLEKAVERTIAWAKRCKKEYLLQIKKRKISLEERPLIFGVIQGGAELYLRERCAKELIKLDFNGYGFGARPIDKDGNFLEEVLQFTADLIPEDKLRFALGIGTPEDIVRCAHMGWDMFDCVIPTREGRHGRLFEQIFNNQYSISNDNKNFYKAVNINNTEFKNDFSSINKVSDLPELREYSRAYLHHLFKVKDPLAARLASLNNLEFYLGLMKSLRDS